MASTDQLNTIYKALVLPRLSYCNVVWGNCNDKIERLQEGAGRAILKVPVRTPSCILLDKLDWTMLSERRRKTLHIAVYKCLAKLVPQGLKRYFTLVQNRHVHQHGEVGMETFPSLFNLKLNPADALSYSGEPKQGMTCLQRPKPFCPSVQQLFKVGFKLYISLGLMFVMTLLILWFFRPFKVEYMMY